MDKMLKDSLLLLGLTSKEIRFFSACLTLGGETINTIAKTARLERSTAYLIAQDLIEKGFVEENYREYKKKLTAIEPAKILRMLAAKQRVLGRQALELKEKLPELQTLYHASAIRPDIRVFEGNKGLLTVQYDILSTKNEILLWTNQETESDFFTPAYHRQFIEERKRKKIIIRALAVNNEKGRLLNDADTDSLRITKILPKQVTFSSETYLYDNKIAVLDYKKDIIGIIIQSEPIAVAQKAIFELTWNATV